jgi:hypothetical protein
MDSQQDILDCILDIAGVTVPPRASKVTIRILNTLYYVGRGHRMRRRQAAGMPAHRDAIPRGDGQLISQRRIAAAAERIT